MFYILHYITFFKVSSLMLLFNNIKCLNNNAKRLVPCSLLTNHQMRYMKNMKGYCAYKFWMHYPYKYNFGCLDFIWVKRSDFTRFRACMVSLHILEHCCVCKWMLTLRLFDSFTHTKTNFMVFINLISDHAWHIKVVDISRNVSYEGNQKLLMHSNAPFLGNCET